jgi:uncharacterized protein YndB with AHSA1/START domain
VVATTSSSSGSANALTVTRTSDTSVELSRTFDFPRRLIFEAISKPEHITRWWGRRQDAFTTCDMDFRPGGKWRFVTRDADGAEWAFRGEYREIEPPERVVQTFEFEGAPGHISVETMTLDERGGKTTMHILSVIDSREAMDAYLASGMEEGAGESYDRLEEYLATLE